MVGLPTLFIAYKVSEEKLDLVQMVSTLVTRVREERPEYQFLATLFIYTISSIFNQIIQLVRKRVKKEKKGEDHHESGMIRYILRYAL